MLQILPANLPAILFVPMSRPKPSKFPSDPQYLVQKLTVKDAQHLLRNEGGEISINSVIMRLSIVAVIAVFTARAIGVGDATAYHLILPSIAEYLTLLIAMPIIQLFLKHDAIKKDAKGGLRLLIGLLVIASILNFFRARHLHQTWSEHAQQQLTAFGNWIVDYQMHWAMLGASAGILIGLPGRIRMLHKHGPPFQAVSLGCGARLGVLFLGMFLTPIVVAAPATLAWVLWTLLIVSEIVALAMIWDIQKRLKARGLAL